MDDTQIKSKQKQRCPNKTRKNPKTGNCDPIEDAPSEPTKRCPKKTRRNPNTGACEPIQQVQFVFDENSPTDSSNELVEPAAVFVEPVVVGESPLVEEEVESPLVESPVVEEESPLVEEEVEEEKDPEKESNSCNYDLSQDTRNLTCTDVNYYSPQCNKVLLKTELVEQKCLSENPDATPYLYPSLNDKGFNDKIANKKEFSDTKYDGTIHSDIEEYANIMSNADFELQPHQIFVKNFLSFQTPYNSLLLYHGLGTGKTCSAIGVCEEMRDYMKQIGTKKRIIIVASENVQNNFRSQLFDERRLKQVNGVWTIKGCVGNKLIKEVNPMNMKGLTKDKLISNINRIIDQYYIFMGYGQFANYIIKIMNRGEGGNSSSTRKQGLDTKTISRLRSEFDDRLIVIDEVHNIRKTEDNDNKKVAVNLELLVTAAENMRFLLLSATPMYNSYKEIIWLLNLMNTNDRRGRIEVKDVFDKNGDFIKPGGEEMLIRKATGYISVVRGENPYTFPYRVYPSIFAEDHTFSNNNTYPPYQMNLKKINEEDKDRRLELYLLTIKNCGGCGSCQYCSYRYIINYLRNKEFSYATKLGTEKQMPNFENMESFGYTLLQPLLQSLIISYPINGLKDAVDDIPPTEYVDKYDEAPKTSVDDEITRDIDKMPTVGEAKKINEEGEDDDDEKEEEEDDDEEEEDDDDDDDDKKKKNKLKKLKKTKKKSKKASVKEFAILPKELTGKRGLERMMKFTETQSNKGAFEYRSNVEQEYGRIFARDVIGKYSSKIKNVIESIVESDGIILIYSQFIDSGLIPMALALEEIGFTRYGETGKSLFAKKPSKSIISAKYAMITGDPRLSPDNEAEVKGLTNENNKDGAKIKVVLISTAGSEGIDLKFIRQVHILEPWYNMNRLEQIIGRAVRNSSHKDLPFSKRNVQIFMYGTLLGEENMEESADLYVYRAAERKAIQIGEVSRVLKESAVDCIINHEQTNFTQEKIEEKRNEDGIDEKIEQKLSTGLVIKDFKVGDIPYSSACDYMSTCSYKCRAAAQLTSPNEDTYNEKFISVNSDKIIQKIRILMKENFFYKKNILLDLIQRPKEYPIAHINYALTRLIEDNNEFIVDKYGRNGRLVNVGDYYMFQPIEIQDKNASIYDRSVPIDYKHEMVDFVFNTNIEKGSAAAASAASAASSAAAAIREHVNGKKILHDINENVQITNEYKEKDAVERADHNWYKHLGVLWNILIEDEPDIEDKLMKYLIHHEIEILEYNNKLDLMNYVYSMNPIDKDSIEMLIKNYFDNNIIRIKNVSLMLMYDLTKKMIMKLGKDNVWVNAESEDIRRMDEDSKTTSMLTFDSLKDKNKYKDLIGYIGYTGKNNNLIFKTKLIASDRDTGATCVQSEIDKIKERLNIVKEGLYETLIDTASTMKNIKKLSKDYLCIAKEFFMRYYNDIEKDKKSFITPEIAIHYKFYK